MKTLLFGIILLYSTCSYAQYLEANRNTFLKKAPRSSSGKIIASEITKGEFLHLLDGSRQTNGYYHVRINRTGIEGWIYRSLVKRRPGPLPKFIEEINGTEIYVVDVGAGLGCIIKTPEGKYIIYDGGNGHHVFKFLKSIYKVNQEIELVICSHTDTDHWDAIQKITENYKIKKALYTSYRPNGLKNTISNTIEALKKEDSIVLTDIAEQPIIPGKLIYEEGNFNLRFLSGFGKENELFAKDLGGDVSKLRNAASIVISLEFAGKSVLFTGDIVGLKECKKKECDCDYNCISTEKFLLDSVSSFLDSDVIIAPHHGARNASCPEFIKAVTPEYVIFSSGNTHKHPHHLTAMNYHSVGGVPIDNILRTDMGRIPKDDDSNKCNNEWIGVNANKTEKDKPLSDNIKIQISSDGLLIVDYMK